MKNPITLTAESVDWVAAEIAEELLRGHNTYKTETDALRKRIKTGLFKSISHFEIVQRQPTGKKSASKKENARHGVQVA